MNGFMNLGVITMLVYRATQDFIGTMPPIFLGLIPLCKYGSHLILINSYSSNV